MRNKKKKKEQSDLRKFFIDRAIDLENDSHCFNRNPVDSLITLKFSDGHVHHLLPRQTDLKELVDSLIASEGLDFPKSNPSTPSVNQKPIILKNRQAIGDILMMTAGIRDLKQAFPNWPINISTTAMHIWDNNPHLDRSLNLDNAELVEIGPGFLTNASNRDDRHFANAFRISIEEKLGISIKQGPIKPDIWMTEEETKTPIIKPPYWIIVAGEKGDWTAKTYPFNRWEEIVKALPNITFVQIGAKEHKHPALTGKNVINLIGKTQDRQTGIRDLFKLFYFAEGSMGLVSFQMHLAAAFGLPCVTGNTIITTDKGLGFARSLNKKFKAVVDGKAYVSKIGFWKSGIKNVQRLEFESGRFLEVTDNHKILTEGEIWKKAGDLEIGESAIVNDHRKSNPKINYGSKSYAKGYCLGNYLADGTVNRISIKMSWFGKDRRKHHKDGMNLISQAGWNLFRGYTASTDNGSLHLFSQDLYQFALKKGAVSKKTNKKCFTRKVITGNYSYLAGLISGYFDGDGTVALALSKSHYARISCKYMNRLRFLQIVLNSFGIYSKIYNRSTNGPINRSFPNGIYKTSGILFELDFAGENIEKFVEIIRPRNITKLKKLKEIIKKRKISPRKSKFLDTLVNKIDIGKKKVYDCHVSKINAFDANSLYVHNCIVIAGAREPARFTRYPNHQYLCTDGCLPCASANACWHCNLEKTCPSIIEMSDGQRVPKCVDLIKTEDVLRAFNQFYEGGRLSFDHHRTFVLPNPIAKSVPESKVFSLVPEKRKNQKQEINGGFHPENFGFKWGGACITKPDWEFLKAVLEKYKIQTVLEFGSGLSTVLLSTHKKDVVSYETNQNWFKSLKEKEIDKIADLRIWNGMVMQDQLGQFDLAIVDGPPGGKSREISTKIASECSKIVLIHDAGREWERKWQEKYLVKEFTGPGKGGTRWHLWVKNEIAKEEEKKKEVEHIKCLESGKPLFRLFCGTRGDGGAGRSINWFMNAFLDLGWNVEYIFPNPQPSGTFRRCGNPKIMATNNMDVLKAPCDVFMLASDDLVWDFKKEHIVEIMSNINAKRKVMYVNYRIGEIGKIPWTQSWDKYLFLNSELESAFNSNYVNSRPLEEVYSAKTKVLAPPTDLTNYLKIVPDYTEFKIIRHSSQGNAKYAPDFNEKVESILDKFPKVTIRLMPGPSFLKDFGDRVIVHQRNNPPISEFLKLGNVFWYSLPEGFTEGGPRVLLEAQASGLSVVTGNHSGPKDRVVDKVTGFLCDSFEEEINALSELSFEFNRKKMGLAAKEHARKDLDPMNWIEEIIGE